MTGFFVMMGGIVAFVTIIGVMDLLARRQRRRLREQQRYPYHFTGPFPACP